MKTRVLHYSNSTAILRVISIHSLVLTIFHHDLTQIRTARTVQFYTVTIKILVAISESWLTSDVSDSELLPWDYDIFRWDRKTLGNCGDTIRGGGVLLVTRCDFGCKPVHLTKNNNLEISANEINTGNSSGKVLVVVIYQPPNANTNSIYDFVQLLNECSYDKLILLGDFNFPAIT